MALIVPDAEFAREWAREHGKKPDMAALCEDRDFRAAISHAVDRVNAGLSVIEKVLEYESTDDLLLNTLPAGIAEFGDRFFFCSVGTVMETGKKD